MTSKLVLGLSILIIILAAFAFIFYYMNTSTAIHYNNSNISFDYPNKYVLDYNAVDTENSSGYFVLAIDSSSNSSSIIIYQIPINKTINETFNSTQSVNKTTTTTSTFNSSNSSNNTNSSNQTNMTRVSIITTPNATSNTTIQDTVDNLQLFLNELQSRGGTPVESTKNNYTYYTTGTLNSSIADYNASRRIVSSIQLTVNDTVIVKNGYPNFYVIEYLSADNSTSSSNAYSKIIDSFNIGT